MLSQIANLLHTYLPSTKVNKNKKHSAFRGGRRLLGLQQLEVRQLMTGVPAFSSLPGADATIYLDFDGHFEALYGEINTPNTNELWENIATPVFSVDGNDAFSPTELQMIQQIWQCVAEDFAPFNINVTTVAPAQFRDGHELRVAVGGSDADWFKLEPVGGYSITNAFTHGDYVNTVYAFSEEFSSSRSIADVISQECGHAFGLAHQSLWNTFDGTLIEEYNPGTPETGPIMGRPYESDRSLWWNDPYGQTGWHGQDDMAIMADGHNLFSFRTDDHGGTTAAATVVADLNAPIHGIISSNQQNEFIGEDVDCFRVTLPHLPVLKHWTVRVEVEDYSANLDAKLEIYRIGSKLDGKLPTLIGVADPGDDLNAMLNLQDGGQYIVRVRSHGGYGDLGQYTLSFFQSTDVIANTTPIFLPPLIGASFSPLPLLAINDQDLVQPQRALTPTLRQQSTNGNVGAFNAKTAVTANVKSLNAAADVRHPFALLDQAFAELGS
jgi:hypothetical protein